MGKVSDLPHAARFCERAVWTRVCGIRGRHLDLLDARIARRHYAPHSHGEFAVGVCTEGVEAIDYRGERHYSVPGTIVVLEPGEPHTGGPAVASGFAYRVMYPDPALLSEATLRSPHFRDAVIDDPELAEAFRLAHVALSEGAERLDTECRLSWLFGELVCRHAADLPVGAGEVGGGGRIATTVKARLAERMTCPPGLAEIAADLGLSRYQVVRAFRDDVGMPPYAWMAQHRVARARLLLEKGRRPAEVASLVGFADQAHLTRWFRRVVGVTPGAYRNSVQDTDRPGGAGSHA